MTSLPITIKETQEGLLTGKFSAVELVEAYLAKIEKEDKGINAFITVTDDLAYQKAKETDRILKNDGAKALKEKPLLGITVAHKDMFLTKGVRTTAASNVLKDYVPDYSATVVKRMAEAGAIMLGKTN